jgi:20S proteasome alpha/beta subunit
MTICVAALADDGRTIIAAADRMVTVQALSLEVERRRSKVESLGRHHLIMTAGDGFVGDELARELRGHVRSHENVDVESLADFLHRGYQELRARRVQQQILGPIGYTFDVFRDHGAKLGNLAAQVLQSMANFDLQTEIMLAGFINDQARIAHVANPGVLRWTDSFEFYAVGSGA